MHGSRFLAECFWVGVLARNDNMGRLSHANQKEKEYVWHREARFTLAGAAASGRVP